MKKIYFLILAICMSVTFSSPVLAGWITADDEGKIYLGDTDNNKMLVKLSPNVQIAYGAIDDGVNYVMATASKQGTLAYGAQFNVEGIYQSALFSGVGAYTEVDVPTALYGWDATQWPVMLGGGDPPQS